VSVRKAAAVLVAVVTLVAAGTIVVLAANRSAVLGQNNATQTVTVTTDPQSPTDQTDDAAAGDH
jgi:hypothetical protein